MAAKVSRRSFLKKSTTAVAGLATMRLGFNLPPAMAQKQRFMGKTITALIQGGVPAHSTPFYETVKQFEEQFGGKIRLVESPYSGMREKALTDLMTGTGSYDLFQIAGEWDGEVHPHLEDLTPFVKRDGFDISDYHPKALAAMGSIGGAGRFGIPYVSGSYGLLYRKDILEAEGLTPPADFQSYHNHLKMLKEKYTPKGIYATEFAVQGGSAWKSWSSRYWAQGSRLFDDQFRPLYASDSGVKAYEMLLDALGYAPPDVVTYDNAEMTATFLDGRVVFAEHWPQHIAADAENPNKSRVVGKVGYAAMPGGANLNAWSLTISKTSREKDMAWEFIKLLSTPDNTLRWMRNGLNATRLSVLQRDPFRKSLLDNGKVIPLQQSIFGEWWADANKMTSHVLTRQKTPLQALKDNADLWSRLTKQFPPVGGTYRGN